MNYNILGKKIKEWKKMKLSIIVCIHNTKEEYFDACLKSIRENTLKNDEYEILVIDDGSSKNYDKIIKRHDPVYVKTENRGLLSARLYGITIAKGDYIAFCDADDTVSFNYYKPMLKKAEETGADIVINDWAFDTEATKYACGDDITVKEDLCYYGDEILRFFASGKGRLHSYFVQWNKLFKKSLLKKAKEELEKTDAVSNKPFVFSEDALSNFFVFKNAEKLVNTHTGYYFYRVHGMQSVSTRGKGGIVSEVEQMALSLDIMLRNVPNNKYSEEITQNIKEWQGLMARKHYSFAKNQGHSDLYLYIKEKYSQAELSEARVKDSTAYIGTLLLGDNFLEIDRELRRVYKSSEPINVIYNARDEYVSKTLDYLAKNEGKVIDKSAKGIVIVPKRKIKAKHRIVHAKPIYMLGLYVFKKGSKMRAYLKSKL